MTIPVIWKSYIPETPNKGYWDYAMLDAILNKELWNPVKGYDFEFHDDYIPTRGAIVVIPARYHADYVEQINQDIAKLQWCILMLMGDEDGTFPTEKLVHPNMKVWLMLPHNGQKLNVDRFLINGWPTGTREYLKQYPKRAGNRKMDWFFAGQVTHSRRVECVNELEKLLEHPTIRGMLIKSDGFTKGVDHAQYFKYMATSKTVPCPSGAIIPDSFRVWEALEAGCLPLVDGHDPSGKTKDFWNFLLQQDELPFPVINDWTDIAGHIQYHYDVYPKSNNKVFAWWQKYKRQMVYNLVDDIKSLLPDYEYVEDIDDPKYLRDNVTVLIPTSSISLHPDTAMIEQVIASVRERLPDSEIIIMIDGIREEQKTREAEYDEYIRRLLWKCNFEYKNVLPLLFDTHKHQVAMTREALKLVKTPCILFAEHDTPLCEYIPISEMIQILRLGSLDMIRLHHEALILDVHKHLMLDEQPIYINDVEIVRTAQWSQRPHLASTEFYRRILQDHFSPDAKCMIEDGIIGKVLGAFTREGKVGWNRFKLGIYTPPGDMKRSYNLDGRSGDPKYDSDFIY